MLKYSELIQNTEIYLRAKYGTKTVDRFIQRHGIYSILHRSFIDPLTDKRIYSFAMPSNLYLSHYRMKDIKNKAVINADRWLLYTVISSRLLHQPRHIRLYTVLYTLKNSRISNDNGELRWTDKTNGKDSYSALTAISTRVVHQINNNKSLSTITDLASSIECPYHIGNPAQDTLCNIYGNPHQHMLIATTNPSQLSALKDSITRDFSKVCGYSPLNFSIQPLWIDQAHTRPTVINTDDHLNSLHTAMALTTVEKFIKYMFTDYHLQTKDCPPAHYFKRLSKPLQHIIVNCQLTSTKGRHLHHFIRQRTVSKLINNIRHISIRNRFTTYITINVQLSLQTYTHSHTLQRLYYVKVANIYLRITSRPRIHQAGIAVPQGLLLLPTDDMRNLLKILSMKKELPELLNSS